MVRNAEESVTEIPLTKGYVAVIDTADLPLVRGRKWQAKEDKQMVYAVGVVDGKMTRMHVLLMGKKPGMQVDHIDRNGLNNRRGNLRHVTGQVNLWNRRAYSNASSGFRGVTWSSKRSKWRADIKHDGRQRVLGYFANKEDAARAFDKAAKDLRGADAVLNFPHP